MLLLMFRVANARYAVDAGRVHEVVPRVEVRPLPHAPRWLAGLFDYRGRVVPVVDLGRLLGGEGCRALLSTRIVVAETEGRDGRGGGLLGLIAEQVSDVRAVEHDRLATSPAALEHAPYLGAIARDVDGMVQLIEVDRILTGPLLEALEIVGAEEA